MVTIIKYNAGNATSVQNALNRLGVENRITASKELIKNASHVILPGVGHAKSAKASLEKGELWEFIPTLTQPFLGICLGMQLMGTYNEEGDLDGLGLIDAKVLRFPSTQKRVPHMGWNNLHLNQPNDLLKEVENQDFYCVHSYYMEMSVQTQAYCDYILNHSAVVAKDNFYGVQFHPEKSALAGQLLLQNFLKL